MRVMVTGGHGFIGSHVLVQLVEAGHEVACLDIREPSSVAEPVSEGYRFVEGDVTDAADVFDAVARFEPDRVIHLASLLGRPSQNDPRRAFAVNVDGTLNVLEAADTHGVERVVAASSSASYGPSTGDRLTEETPQTPESIYGLTKYAVERIGRTYRDQRGVEFAALEPLHGLGPDRNRGNVEDAYIVKAAVSGVPVEVPDLDTPIEFIYVGDEATAFVAVTLADELAHDRYLVGSGNRATLAEFVEVVRERVPGADVTLRPGREDGEYPPFPRSDSSRLREDVGWEATLDIAETVDTYVEWLEANPDAWTFDPDDAPWGTTD
ncbi:NAD-dependent epimerase/dehydratase family protein [Salinirubellus sp. GCM10025818]|uniref:NAD-dependent epimerase/dehydratase family protein n=1 Tax=Salinirubellus TaxID=2162630 RepID=UPI0030CF995E